MGDVQDSSGQNRHGSNHGADLNAIGPDGKPGGAAGFDGKGAHVTVPVPPLGNADFTLALWVNADQVRDDDLGDLVSRFDSATRNGLHLGLRTNTGVTFSQANTRQLQFGIDAGIEPTWRDEGRPGGESSILAFSLAVHDGRLHAGTCEPAENRAGHVYRYDGPGTWTDLGAPDRSNAVSALCVLGGSLYAGTARYRLGGSALTESPNPHAGGRIFRLDGERWVPCGALAGSEAVGGLVVYHGQLYASSLYRPAGFFRYEGGETWAPLATPDGKRVEALGVFNGFLWATGYDEGHVYRFDGRSWTDTGALGDNTQTYSFAIHHGRLHVGTWRSGKVFRLGDDGRWEDFGRLGEELEVMGMMVHNGSLYAGTLPLAEVYRLDQDRHWTRLKQLDETPDVTYRRAWTMASYGGRLFVSTLPSGKVFSMAAGPCLTFDRAFPPGWHHVAAVRAGDRLRLYLDGKRVAESEPFDRDRLDLTGDQPLQIGAGPGDFFLGRLRDVRLYQGAFSDAEVPRLMEP